MKSRYSAILLMALASVGGTVGVSLASGAGRQLQQAPAAAKPGDPGYIAEDPELARLVGRPGPSIALRAIDGGTIDLARIYGRKPIYLKLWATYCLPCLAQMSGLEKIHKTFGNRLEIVAVDAGVGDDADKVRAFVARTKMRTPVAIDDGSLGAWLKMEATPFHVLIGRDGRIVYAGHQDGPRLDAAIQRVLAEADAAKVPTPIDTAKVETVDTLQPGDLVPAVDLRGPDDTPVRLTSGATSRPRAVLFTSTWCESYLKNTEPQTVDACRRVREQVDELSQRRDIEWLGVATHLWTTPADLGKYQTQMKPRVPMAVDTDGQAFRVFGIRRLPAVALIGTDGHLVRIIGPDDTNLPAAIDNLTRR